MLTIYHSAQVQVGQYLPIPYHQLLKQEIHFTAAETNVTYSFQHSLYCDNKITVYPLMTTHTVCLSKQFSRETQFFLPLWSCYNSVMSPRRL